VAGLLNYCVSEMGGSDPVIRVSGYQTFLAIARADDGRLGWSSHYTRVTAERDPATAAMLEVARGVAGALPRRRADALRRPEAFDPALFLPGPGFAPWDWWRQSRRVASPTSRARATPPGAAARPPALCRCRDQGETQVLSGSRGRDVASPPSVRFSLTSGNGRAAHRGQVLPGNSG
jgi:hypothetical protein